LPNGLGGAGAPRPKPERGGRARTGLPDLVLGHLPIGVAVIDRHARLLYWNTQAAILWDLPPFLTAEHPPLAQAVARLTMLSPGQQERLVGFCTDHVAQGDHVQPESCLRIAPSRDSRLSVQVRGMGRGTWLVMLHDSRTDSLLGRGPVDNRQGDGSYDALTMVRNRQHFERMLTGLPPDARHAVLLVDVNGLDHVNTTKGRAVGDALLCLIARRLPREMRDDDLLARWQDDAFAVLVPNRDGAVPLAERLLLTLAQPFLIEGHTFTAGFGIGIAEWRGSADLLMEHATAALHTAKRQGANHCALFEAPRARTTA
jgi:diguanylate cyclase (GGDEF)-like protein